MSGGHLCGAEAPTEPGGETCEYTVYVCWADDFRSQHFTDIHRDETNGDGAEEIIHIHPQSYIKKTSENEDYILLKKHFQLS